MSEMNEVLKTAMAMAGALGRFQGLIEFVRRNPDYYSREELVAELLKVDSEGRANLDAVETELSEELDKPGMFIDDEEWEKEMGR